MKEKKEKSFLSVLLTLVICGILFGVSAASLMLVIKLFKKEINNNVNNSNTATSTASPTPYSDPSPVSEQNISAIVDFTMPAMVTVECKIKTTSNDFWGRPQSSETSSAGSGIIIAQDGEKLYIATNEHVVSGATSVQVTFCDNTTCQVDVKGSDQNSDLAVLELCMTKLSETTKQSIRIASLGDSTSLKAGDFAIAIGNALGYGQSITVGYISATKREVTVENITRTLLQTDAAINPGNSGGALLNANGEVIGINSAKYASEEVEGIGYAIPISDAIPILTNIINRETLSEKDAGSLGVAGQTVTSAYSSRFGIPVGVYVNSVKANSCAKKAGIKEGDVIVAINGISISTVEDLKNVLSYTKAGTTVTVTVSVLENNEYVEHELEVTLDNR